MLKANTDWSAAVVGNQGVEREDGVQRGWGKGQLEGRKSHEMTCVW